MKPPHQNRPGGRSSGGPRRPGGPFGGRGDKQGRGPERPYQERPYQERPRSERPHQDRPYQEGDRPGRSRPEHDRFDQERSERFGSGRPARANGPHAKGPYAKGPYAKGPHANGPRPNGPYTGGPHAPRSRAPESRFQESRFQESRFQEGGREERRNRPARGEREFPARARSEGPAPGRFEARPEGHRFVARRPERDVPEREAERREERPLRREEPRAPHLPEAPHGSLWLYGLHAVAAALANPARRLRRLLLTEEAEASLQGRLAQPWPLPVEHVERGRLEHLLGRDVVHQGAALLVDPLTPPPLAQALERGGPVLVLDQVSDPRNVGAILRSAQAFGAAAVIVQERNAPDETGALAKAASGALEKVPLLRAVNLARTLVALRAAGCWVVGLDAGGGTLSGPAFAGRRVALVLGSEGEGLRRLTRETCDEIVGIAMPGADVKGADVTGGAGLDSLNVSAAAAVALYELGRAGTERQS